MAGSNPDCTDSPTGYHWLVGTGQVNERMELSVCKYCPLERWVAITWDKCQEESSKSPKTPPIYVKPDKLKKPVGRQFQHMTTGGNLVMIRRRYP